MPKGFVTPTSDLTTWIRISDPGSEILGSGSHGSIEKLIKVITLLWTGEAVHGLLGMYILAFLWYLDLADEAKWPTRTRKVQAFYYFVSWYFIIPFACDIGGKDLQRQTDSLTVYFYVLLFAIYIYSKYDWFDWFNLHIHYHTFSRWHGSS